jgi:IclR family mhp operon transcriptional activator
MASFPPVQSVVRAVKLLQALNLQPVSTIDALHRQTRIPKPSLVRLLQTLGEVGLVRHAPQHGAYVLTSQVRSLACGFHSEPRVVEAAAPVLDRLTESIKWPAALAMLEDLAAVVRYSTIPLSPLALLHSTIGMHLSLASRALGRAYLAFCEHESREFLLQALMSSGEPEDMLARDLPALRGLLDTVRANGYATRDPDVRPVSSTLAVPVFESGRVIASIGITFFSSTLSVPQAVERYLEPLQEAARRIAAALEQPRCDAAGEPTQDAPADSAAIAR